MSFTVPTGWKMLSEDDLRYCLRLLWLYGETADMEQRVQTAAFVHFAGIEVVNRTTEGWLCIDRKSKKRFLLDPDLLPSILQPLSWLTQADKIDVRLAQVGDYRAVDFELRTLPFGNYLSAENFYQGFLMTREQESLVSLASMLYNVPEDGDVSAFRDEVLIGAFLWFGAAKQVLATWFPNFLKPAGEDGGSISQESQFEAMKAQIRLLTKGDVTKEDYILNHVDTWTALAELDALAKEAEELKKKYGK